MPELAQRQRFVEEGKSYPPSPLSSHQDFSDIEAVELALLLEAINTRYGYDLRDYATASMQRRVASVLARTGLRHMGELQHRTLADPEFFTSVLEGLTVRVSQMFRDPTFYLAFRTLVVPVLRTYPRIKVWHAGCATGEEVYASAILFHEEGLFERTQFYGTDLSPSAIEAAKSGIYAQDRIAEFTDNYRKSGGKAEFADYHTSAMHDGVVMKEFLRRNLLFFQHNLVSDHVFGEMQVIFCRNVLIYFGRDLRRRVISRFAESLCPGGFLCFGSSERAISEPGFSEFGKEMPIYRHGR